MFLQLATIVVKFHKLGNWIINKLAANSIIWGHWNLTKSTKPKNPQHHPPAASLPRTFQAYNFTEREHKKGGMIRFAISRLWVCHQVWIVYKSSVANFNFTVAHKMLLPRRILLVVVLGVCCGSAALALPRPDEGSSLEASWRMRTGSGRDKLWDTMRETATHLADSIH